jgi:hypothetical protein
MGRDKPRQSELVPIDWAGIELQYRAGIKPLRVIATQFGCAHSAITKRAKRDGWQRDLKARVHARADELVHKALVSKEVHTAAVNLGERYAVEASAQAEVLVRLGHREDIAALRAIIKGLMRELSVVIEQPERFGMIHDALSSPDELALDALRNMAALVVSLPGRTKVAKDLADALHRAVGMEREAFGLDTAAGTEGRPMVIIRDFTGRGNPDAPVRPNEAA